MCEQKTSRESEYNLEGLQQYIASTNKSLLAQIYEKFMRRFYLMPTMLEEEYVLMLQNVQEKHLLLIFFYLQLDFRGKLHWLLLHDELNLFFFLMERLPIHP